jgi:rhamnosyltransferase subunit B
MARIVFVTFGTLGDVAPFVTVALALRQRGHDVAFLSSTAFEDRLRSLKFEYASLDTGELVASIQELMAGKLLDSDPITSFKVASAQYFLPVARLTFEHLARHEDPARTLVVASQLAFGARLARERYGFRVADLHLQPFYSAYDPSHNLPMPLRKGPVWLRQAGFYLLERLSVDTVLSPGLDRISPSPNGARRRRILSHWNHSPDGVLGLFPDWFAPVQRDWPPGTVLTGFVPGPSASEPTPPPEWLSERLQAGERFVVFSAGTGVYRARHYFDTAVALCTQMRIPGLLVTRDDASVPHRLPEDVRHVQYVDFRQLLPSIAALVHPAGIGTIATALAAGCPQLLTPFTNDQPDNAARTERLGAAFVLPACRFTVDAARPMLERVLGDSAMKARCMDLSTRIDFEASTAAAAQYLERRTLS